MRANQALANRPEHQPARVIGPAPQYSALRPNGSFVRLSLAVICPAGIIQRFGLLFGSETAHGVRSDGDCSGPAILALLTIARNTLPLKLLCCFLYPKEAE